MEAPGGQCENTAADTDQNSINAWYSRAPLVISYAFKPLGEKYERQALSVMVTHGGLKAFYVTNIRENI